MKTEAFQCFCSQLYAQLQEVEYILKEGREGWREGRGKGRREGMGEGKGGGKGEGKESMNT